MKKCLILFSIAILCTLTLRAQDNGLSLFKNLKRITVDNNRIFVVDFLTEELADGIVDDTLSITTGNTQFANTSSRKYHSIDQEVSDFQPSLYYFSDIVTIDSMAASKISDQEQIGFGRFEANEVQNFRASSKTFAGKVELSWSQFPDADGYIIIRSTGNPIGSTSNFQAFHVIESGITTSWVDTDVLNYSSFHYYIVAFNVTDEDRRFVSAAAHTQGQTDNLKFLSIQKNEEITSLWWSYDNSIVGARELEAISERIISSGASEEIYNKDILIENFNIGDPRLDFNTVELSKGDGFDGIYVKVPSPGAIFTYEFWLNVGELGTSVERLLSDDANQSWIGISKNTIALKQQNEDLNSIPHNFKSNKWTHFAFVSNGGNLKVIVDGQEIGELTSPQVFPTQFGTHQGLTSTPFVLSSSQRLGIVRLWDINRTADQVNQDLYDIYTGAVTNLRNQWLIPEGITQSITSGLLGAGNLEIFKTSDYDGSPIGSKAYIFDQRQISQIFKYPTDKKNLVFDILINERGSGREILSANAVTESVKATIPNQLDLSYDKNNFGRVNLSYLPGSVYPSSYALKRADYLGQETTLTTFEPTRINHMAKYDGTSVVDLGESIDQSSTEQSYRFLLKTDQGEVNEDVLLVDLGDISINATKESQLELNVTGNYPVFLTTVKDERWRSIGVVLEHSAMSDSLMISVYLDGIAIDTLKVQSVNLSKLELLGSKERPFYLAYVAHKEAAEKPSDFIEGHKISPSIVDGWSIFYHNTTDLLLKSSVSGDFALSNLQMDTLFNYPSTLNISLENYFYNKGSIISNFTWSDVYSDQLGNHLHDSLQYTYTVVPQYLYTDQGLQNSVSQEVRIVDLNFRLSNISNEKVGLQWSVDTLATYGYDSIAVYRNSELLGYSYRGTSWIDSTMAYGQKHVYEIRPFRNGNGRLHSIDSIHLAANGVVSGFLLSEKNDFIVPNSSFEVGRNDEIPLNLSTDEHGRFYENNISYGLYGVFKAANDTKGNFELTKAKAQAENIFFRKQVDYNSRRVSNLIDSDSISWEANDRDQLTFTLKKSSSFETVAGDYYINIYVDGQLSEVLVNSLVFEDKFGKGDSSAYRFVMYYFDSQDHITFDSYDLGNVNNAAISPVQNLSASINSIRHQPEISWEYINSERVDGFRIWSVNATLGDSSWMADVPSVLSEAPLNHYSILDRNGIAPNEYIYYLAPFYSQSDSIVILEDFIVSTTSIQYPDWKSTSVYSLSFSNDFKELLLTPNGGRGLGDLPFDGFMIMNDGEIVNGFEITGYHSTNNSTYIFRNDYLSFASDTYEPNIYLYKKVNGSIISEALTSDGVQTRKAGDGGIITNAPRFATSTLVSKPIAEQMQFVNIGWDRPSKQPEFYTVYISGQSQAIDTIPGYARNYAAAFDQFEGIDGQSVDVTIMASHLHEGQIVMGDQVVTESYRFGNNQADDIAHPSNVMASLHGVGRIAVSWDFPSFGLARFEIYRNGDLIANMETYHRSFVDQDETLEPGKYYVYHVRSVYNGEMSPFFGSSGRMLYPVTLQGEVLDVAGNPMPFVEVKSGNQSVLTDSTGFYQLNFYDIQEGDPHNVQVFYTSLFPIGTRKVVSKSLTFENHGYYRLDFRVDDVLTQPHNTSLPAKLINLYAHQDNYNHHQILRWTVSNNNYSHFDIYKNDKKVGEVSNGSSLQFIDQEAIPGFTVNYRVVPVYTNRDGQTIEDTSVRTRLSNVLLDNLKPVDFLEATRFDKEGKISLNWVHERANATGYLLSRDLSGETEVRGLSFEDNAGVPGSDYQYVVKPFLRRNGEIYFPQTGNARVQVTFPSVAQVKNLNAQLGDSGFDVKLTWDHPDVSEGISGYKIEREEDEIAVVNFPANSFTDAKGIPNTLTVYHVSTLKTLDEDSTLYESAAVTDTIWFPTVRPIATVSFTEKPDTLEMSWGYGTGVDYFLAKVKNAANEITDYKIAAVDSANTYRLNLLGYIPGEELHIELRGVKKINGQEYYSELVTRQVNFPSLPPLNFLADKHVADSMYYKIYWEYSSFNIDAIEVLVNGVDRFHLQPGARSFTYPMKLVDVQGKPGTNQTNSTTFRLTIKKDVDGESFDYELEPLTLSQSFNGKKYSPFKINATDNAVDEVRVSWSINPSQVNNVTRWEIFRDGLSIADLPFNLVEANYEYFDNQALPGQTYLYQVRGYAADGNEETYLVPDLGSRKGEASVLVAVYTAVGSAPMDQIPFTLKGELDPNEGHLVLRGETDNSGQLKFSNLPYKNKNGQDMVYEFTPDFPANHFDGESTFAVQFTNEDELKVLPNVWYNRANSVRAITKFDCTPCGIDSISLRLETYTQPDLSDNSLREARKLVTNDKGYVTFDVPPASNLYYRLSIDKEGGSGFDDNSGQNGSDDGTPDLVYTFDDRHTFDQSTLEFSNTDFTKEGVFSAQMTDLNDVPLQLSIVNTCGTALGAYEFRVRVIDLEGKNYDSTFYTQTDGTLDVDVPPYNLSIRVTGVRQADAFSSLALDYFRSRSFNQYYGDDFTYYLDNNDKINAELNTTTTAFEKLLASSVQPVRIEFQQTPDITTNDFQASGNGCGNGLLILDGDAQQQHTVRFSITDNNCPVNQGYILVKNPGAAKPFEFNGGITNITEADLNQLVSIDRQSNQFVYTFTADKPNMVAPYTHLVEVYYFDDNLQLRSSANYQYAVTGSKLIEGNDVFIDPTDEFLGEFQVPFLVLRDPPGDNSYSYVEAGQEFSMTLKTTKEFKARGSIGYVNNFEAFLITNDNSDWAIEYNDNSTNTQTIKFRTTDKISTAKSSLLSTNLQGYLDGPEADVISGAGIAYKYGLMDVLSLNGCGLDKTQRYDLVADEIKTTWTYTRSMIKQTIKYYDSLLNGSTDLTNVQFELNDITARDGEILQGADFNPEAFINNALANWRALLQHVDVISNPVCKLLDKYDEITLTSQGDNLAAANEMAGKLRNMTKDEGNVFIDDTDATIENIRDDIKSYLDELSSFKAYVEGLGADVCTTLSPLMNPNTSAPSIPEWNQDSFVQYGRAYEALVKLNIISDYANQLSTIENYSSVDNLDELQSDPLNGFNILGGIARSAFLTKNIKSATNQVILDAYKAAVIQNIDNYTDLIYDELIKRGYVNDDIIRATNLRNRQRITGNLSRDELKFLKNFDKARNKAQSVVFNELVQEGLPEAAKNAGKTAAKRAAGDLAREAAENASRLAKFKPGFGFVKFSAGILVNAALVAGHTLVGTRSYNFLREYFIKDLESMDLLSERSLEEIMGYSPQENITFSGGTTIEKTISSSSASETNYEGYWGSYLDSEMEIGVGYEGDIWGGIAAGTEASVGDGKLAAKIKFNDKIAQKINSGQGSGTSFKVGYHLSDNDDGDHFNVQVLNYAQAEEKAQIGTYYHLIGGRSSSPYEEGTISRDLPTISFEDDQGNKYPTLMYDLDPSVSQTIPVKITSGNKFQEGRSYAVTITANSNNNGAALLLSNSELFVGRSNNYFVPAGVPAIYTNLVVDAKPGIFEYPDLDLVIRPLDIKDDFFSDGADVFDTLSFEMNFRKPVSPVAISQHDGSWAIRGISEESSKENYIFYLTGYDVEGRASNLQYIQMEYKRAGEGQFDWEPLNRIIPGNTHQIDTLDIVELHNFYLKNIRVYNQPTFPFEWDVTGLDIVDGSYLVRAIAYDENGLFSYSNVYQGVIDRSGPKLIDRPAPRDEVFSFDDQVFAEFDETFDADYFDSRGEATIEIFDFNDQIVKTIDRTSVENLGFDVSASGNRIVVSLGSIASDYDGHTAKVTLKGIQDAVGNPVQAPNETVTWSFKLDHLKQSPSAITLDGPDHWTVIDDELSPVDSMIFSISGYDVYQTFSSINNVDLEVNLAGSGIWRIVDTYSSDDLLMAFDSLNDSQAIPRVDIHWLLLSDPNFVAPDGIYQVRAALYGAQNQVNYSNVLNGTIDRSAPVLSGIPSPADKILSKGELVSFSFNEPINITNDSIKIDVTINQIGVDPRDYSITFNDNGINITFSEVFMQSGITDSVNVKVEGVYDIVGNAGEQIDLKFKIDYHEVPASNVTIENHGNWLINTTSGSRFPIVLTNYDVYATTSNLDHIVLEYRSLRKSSIEPDVWNEIRTLNQSELINHYESSGGIGIPKDTILWDIQLIPDGEYELRAIAHGGQSYTVSNYVSGRIDKTAPTVLGQPEPINKVLTYNDVARISFSETINYFNTTVDSLKNNLFIYTAANVQLDADEYTVSVSGNSVEIVFSDNARSVHKGESLRVDILGITDLSDNPLLGQIDWNFKVVNEVIVASPAFIATPSNFTVFQDNKFVPVEFRVEGYDLFEFYSELDEMHLQYKREEQNENQWTNIQTFTKSDLIAMHTAQQQVNPDSGYPFALMQFDSKKSGVVDGNYQVRVAIFGGGAFAYSNIISGVVDRRRPQVITTTPEDGVYSRGDEVSISFSESLDITSPINVKVSREVNGQFQLVNNVFNAIWSSDKVVLQPLIDLAVFDRDRFQVEIPSVRDLVGNKSVINSIKHSFTIDYFRLPVSSVRIKQPSFFIVNNEPSSSNVPFILDGFELNAAESALESIDMQVKLVEAQDDQWTTFSTINRAALESANSGNGPLEFRDVWQVPAEQDPGHYVMRAMSKAGSQYEFSNYLEGVVDRLAPEVASFEPVDHILGRKDLFLISFNEDLRKTQLVEVIIKDSVDNDISSKFAIVQSVDAISITPLEDLFTYTGTDIKMEMNQVYDLYGNQVQGTIERYVTVDYTNLSATPVEIQSANNFVVNSVSNDNHPVVVGSFDLFEEEYALETLTLEVHKLEDSSWRQIAVKTKDQLLSENNDPDKLPSTLFELPVSELEEGTFEVRIKSEGNQQFEYSNLLNGHIDRTRPQLIFEPQDGVYEPNDLLGFIADETINGNADVHVVLSDALGNDITDLFNSTITSLGLQLYPAATGVLNPYDKQEITLSLKTAVFDLAGNHYEGSTDYQFTLALGIVDPSINTSPVAITSGKDELTVDKSTGQMEIEIGEYDLALIDYALDSIVLYYAETFSNEWIKINQVTLKELREHYLNTGLDSYKFKWMVEEEQVEDGAYTLKAIAYGNAGVPNSSEPVLIRIDRKGPGVIRVQELDGEIQFVFDEPIAMDTNHSQVVLKQLKQHVTQDQWSTTKQQEMLPNHAAITSNYYEVIIKENVLTVVFSDHMLREFSGLFMEIDVKEVYDNNGNPSKVESFFNTMIPEIFSASGSDFNGSYNAKGGIDLKWNHSIQDEGYQMSLQRFDGDKFNSLVTFDSETDHETFLYTDNHNFIDAIYYRIKYTNDGEEIRSKIIKVEIDESVHFEPIAMLYPNPTDDRFRINFSLLTRDYENKITARVYNPNGVVIKNEVFEMNAIPDTLFVMEFENRLNSGLYLVEIIQGDAVSILKLVVK